MLLPIQNMLEGYTTSQNEHFVFTGMTWIWFDPWTEVENTEDKVEISTSPEPQLTMRSVLAKWQDRCSISLRINSTREPDRITELIEMSSNHLSKMTSRNFVETGEMMKRDV